MTVSISSFTSNPSPADVFVGDDVQFTVVASDSNGATLAYEWEVRPAGSATYVGISGAITDTYTATNLQITDNGNRYRVKVSEAADPSNFQYSSEIQVTVTAQPSIIILQEPTESEIVASSGQSLTLTVRGRILNIDRTDAAQVSLLTFTWEEYDENALVPTWNPVVLGPSITQSDQLVEDSSVSPSVYDKESSLTFTSISTAQDQKRYRARLEYATADNTPLYSNNNTSPPGVKIVVNPSITVISNTTATPSTLVSYNANITGSGETTLTVSATTTAGASVLSYRWQYTVDSVNYIDILSTGASSFDNFTVPPGSNLNSSTLPLVEVRYYPTLGFRCIISGSLGETDVTTSTAFLTITQSVDPNQVVNFVDVNVIEDRYGNVSNRSSLGSAIRTARLEGSVDTSNDTGIHGDNITVQIERQDPGSSTWNVVQISTGGTIQYTADDADISRFFYFYVTDPVRIAEDDGAQFRQVVSVSNPTAGSTNPITLSPITLNVFPTAFIDSQPAAATVFEGQTTSYSVGASASSGQTLIYQWQYSSTGVSWLNVPEGTVSGNFSYTGTQTDTLVLSNVPSTIGFSRFRCVVDVAGSLSSVTSNAAALTITTDNFVFISNLNNVNVLETGRFSFTASATSESGGVVSYQWQRSATSNGPWTNIPGETNQDYVVISATNADAGFYRAQVTSPSGAIDATNAAEVTVISNVVTVTNINVPATIDFIENIPNQLTFEVEASASDGSVIEYQWQFFNTTTSNWEDLGLGFNNTTSTTRFYTFGALDKPTFNGIRIRCACTAITTNTTEFSNESVISIIRTLSYQAFPASFDVTVDGSFEWDLRPTLSGGTATYQWQINTAGTPFGGGWSDITVAGTNPTYDGFNTSSLRVSDIPSSLSSAYFRCIITAPLVDRYIFNRTPAPSPLPTGGATVFSQMFVSPVVVLPNYYTEFRQRTGAAIGTVICVPKMINYTAPTIGLDTEQFGAANVNGYPEYPFIDGANAVTGSTEISYDLSGVKPSDVFRTMGPNTGPYSQQDRHPGFIEMRGQFLRCVDFPELARVLGTRYGGNITGTYPNYTVDDYFALPMPIAKRLMGTGRVDNNTGSASVEPQWGPAYEPISGTNPTSFPRTTGLFQSSSAGAGIDEPGSIGGVYNYTRTAQLPPGSPGDINNDGVIGPGESGTADGRLNEETFQIGRFSTDGWEDCSNQIEVFFSGIVEYAVGDSTNGISDATVGIPEHGHRVASTGVRTDSGFNTSTRASGRTDVFPLYDSANGRITTGPDGINDPDRGITHSHGLAWTGLSTTVIGSGSATGPGSGGVLGVGGPYFITVAPGVSEVTINLSGGGGGGGGSDSGSPGGNGGTQAVATATFNLGPAPASGHVIVLGIGSGGGGGGSGGPATGGRGGSVPSVPNLGYNLSGGKGGNSGSQGYSGAGGGGGAASWAACSTLGGSNNNFELLMIAGGSGGGGGGGLGNSLGAVAQQGDSSEGGVNLVSGSAPGGYTGGAGGDRSGDGAGGGGSGGGAQAPGGAPASGGDDDAFGGGRGRHWVNSTWSTAETAFINSGTDVAGGPAGRASGQNGNDGFGEVLWVGGPSSSTPGNAQLNHDTGIGDSLGTLQINRSYSMEVSAGNAPSGNIIAPPGVITMSNISRTNFDSNLSFTLRNNDQIPVVAPNFRLVYLIKAF